MTFDDHTLYGRDDDVDEFGDVRGHGPGLIVKQLGALGQAAGQPGELQLQAGQRLAQFIVNFPRDANLFLFADVLQIDRKGA